jgi:hypothetical protein
MPASSHNNGYGYDRRFCGLLLDQLSLRDHPTYPDNRWFTSLYRADYEFQRLGPLRSIPSPGTGHNFLPSSTSGQPEPRQHYADNTSRLVGGACAEWLRQRNLYG